MSVLITGSSGYIGTELCRRYAAAEHSPRIVGIDLAPPREEFSNLTFYQLDCNGDLSPVFQRHKVDTIIHLVYVLNMTHDSQQMYRINVGSLENILNYASQHGVARVVVTSSATAYGAHPDNPPLLTEDDPLRGNHDFQYAYNKTIVEDRLNLFATEYPDVDVVIARPAIVCGAHISNFISRYINKPLVPLVKDSLTEMQFLHEEDAADALFTLATEAPAGVYNLGPPNTIHHGEAVKILGGRSINVRPGLLRFMTALAWTLRLKYFAEAPASMINFIQYPWVVDGSKIEELTSFRYRYSSEDAIRAFEEARNE
ncbi:MAG: NAD-dependent epimerase/dehydratase family protein [Fidelibacterota bacterium]